jgi:hypothetical protein
MRRIGIQAVVGRSMIKARMQRLTYFFSKNFAGRDSHKMDLRNESCHADPGLDMPQNKVSVLSTPNSTDNKEPSLVALNRFDSTRLLTDDSRHVST